METSPGACSLRLVVPAAALLSALLVTACGAGQDGRPPTDTGPTTGDLKVTASTSGRDQDADGYTVTVDGAESASIGPDGSTTFTDLAAGDHEVELSGIRGNCSIEGNNPRTVRVALDSTSSTTFSVECRASGDLEVSPSSASDTTDRDGYTVAVDGSRSTLIGPDGSTTFTDLAEGDREVKLTGVQANCGAAGSNTIPRTALESSSTPTAPCGARCSGWTPTGGTSST